MRPDRFDTFSMGHPNTIHVGKVKVCLTQYTVSNDVELWNCGMERIEGLDVERRAGVVFGEMKAKIFSPLTADVIGDDNVFDPSIDISQESQCESVINVDISRGDSQ